MSRTVEIVIFSLKPGVQTEAFLRAAEAASQALLGRPFIETIDPASALVLHTRPVLDSGA